MLTDKQFREEVAQNILQTLNMEGIRKMPGVLEVTSLTVPTPSRQYRQIKVVTQDQGTRYFEIRITEKL